MLQHSFYTLDNQSCGRHSLWCSSETSDRVSTKVVSENQLFVIDKKLLKFLNEKSRVHYSLWWSVKRLAGTFCTLKSQRRYPNQLHLQFFLTRFEPWLASLEALTTQAIRQLKKIVSYRQTRRENDLRILVLYLFKKTLGLQIM